LKKRKRKRERERKSERDHIVDVCNHVEFLIASSEQKNMRKTG